MDGDKTPGSIPDEEQQPDSPSGAADASGGDSGGAGASAVATPQEGDPGAVAAAARAQDAQPKVVAPQPSFLQKAYSGAMGVLGGKTNTTYQPDAKGNIVPVVTPRSPGDAMRHVVASMLTGMAAGTQAYDPRRPGAPILTGLGAGAEAVMQQARTDDDRARAQAQNNLKNNQAADEMTMRKAADARAQQESVLQSREYDQKFKAFDYQFDKLHQADQQEMADRWNAREAAGVKPLMVDGKPVPEFDTMKEANDFAMQHKAEMIGGYMNRVDVDPNTHKFVVGQVPAEKQDFTLSVSDGQGGKKQVSFNGTPNDYLTLQGKQADLDKNKTLQTEANMRIGEMKVQQGQQTKMLQAQNAWQKSLQASDNDVDTAKAYMKKTYPAEMSFLQAGELNTLAEKGGTAVFSEGVGAKDPFTGKPAPVTNEKEHFGLQKTFNKDYVEDANKLDRTYQQMQDIITTAQKTGKLTGAASVVGLFNAIGISADSLKGKGFRMSNEITGEHKGARDILSSAAVSAHKLDTGQVVTLKQLQDYNQILGKARHDMYVTAGGEADRQGLVKDFLPRGNGRVADTNTMQIYLTLAKNDPDMATQAMTRMGWKIPPSTKQAEKPPLVMNKPVVQPAAMQ